MTSVLDDSDSLLMSQLLVKKAVLRGQNVTNNTVVSSPTTKTLTSFDVCFVDKCYLKFISVKPK